MDRRVTIVKSMLRFLVLLVGAVIWYSVAVSWGEDPLVYSRAHAWFDTSANLNTVLFLAYSGIILISFGYSLGRWRARADARS